jgi:hypothetical protein
MHSIKTALGVACGALLVSAAPALAQTQPTTGSAPTAKAKDPNRVICEKVQDTGSRIGGKRICMTAAQWEEQRRRDRQYVEDAQQRSLEPNSG